MELIQNIQTQKNTTMNQEQPIIVGLDIGTTKIAAIAGRKNEFGKLEILGFGRAIGETMIVLMAAGNASNITSNIFLSVRTMTATIAAEMGEVSQGSDH